MEEIFMFGFKFRNKLSLSTYARVSMQLDFGLKSTPEGLIALSNYGKTLSMLRSLRIAIEKFRETLENMPATFNKRNMDLPDFKNLETKLNETESETRRELEETQKRVVALSPEVLYEVGNNIGIEAGTAVKLPEKTVSEQLAESGADTSKRDNKLLKQETEKARRQAEVFLKEKKEQGEAFEKEYLPEISRNTDRLSEMSVKLEKQYHEWEEKTKLRDKQQPGTYAPQPSRNKDIDFSR